MSLKWDLYDKFTLTKYSLNKFTDREVWFGFSTFWEITPKGFFIISLLYFHWLHSNRGNITAETNYFTSVLLRMFCLLFVLNFLGSIVSHFAAWYPWLRSLSVHLLSKERYTCKLRVNKQGTRVLGGTPRKHLLGYERLTSQTPYLIYDQNLRLTLPSLWQDQNFDTLFMTVAAGSALNLIFEGLLFMVS